MGALSFCRGLRYAIEANLSHHRPEARRRPLAGFGVLGSLVDRLGHDRQSLQMQDFAKRRGRHPVQIADPECPKPSGLRFAVGPSRPDIQNRGHCSDVDPRRRHYFMKSLAHRPRNDQSRWPTSRPVGLYLLGHPNTPNIEICGYKCCPANPLYGKPLRSSTFDGLTNRTINSYHLPTDAMKEEPPPQKRKSGRPPVSRELRKNKHLAFRVRDKMQERLQASADIRGLSISEEVERRVALSFDLESSPEDEYVIRAVAQAMQLSQVVTGKKWSTDAITSMICFRAITSAAQFVQSGFVKTLSDDDIGKLIGGTALKDLSDKEGDKLASAAGASIGKQVSEAYAGRSIDEVRKIGQDHILAVMDYSIRNAQGNESFGLIPGATEAGAEQQELGLGVRLADQDLVDKPSRRRTKIKT